MIAILILVLIIPVSHAMLDIPTAIVNESFAITITPENASVLGLYIPEGIEIVVPPHASYDETHRLLVFENQGPISITAFSTVTGRSEYELVYVTPPATAGIIERTGYVILEPQRDEPYEDGPEPSEPRTLMWIMSGILIVGMALLSRHYRRRT